MDVNLYSDEKQVITAVYSTAEVVPSNDELGERQQMHPWVGETLTQGKGYLFGHLKSNWPLFYNALMAQNDELVLVKLEYKDDIGREGFEQYHWALPCQNRLMVFGKPDDLYDPNFQKEDVEFSGKGQFPEYYLDLFMTFDNIGVFGHERCESMRWLTKLSRTDYQENALERRELLNDDDRSYLKHRPGKKMRFIMEVDAGDYVMLDAGKKDFKMYYVHQRQWHLFKEIKNANAQIDRFLANTVLDKNRKIETRFGTQGDVMDFD